VKPPPTPAQEHIEHLLNQGCDWIDVLVAYREAAIAAGVARRPRGTWKTVNAGFMDIHRKLERTLKRIGQC
jgi:hypothetical protein